MANSLYRSFSASGQIHLTCAILHQANPFHLMKDGTNCSKCCQFSTQIKLWDLLRLTRKHAHIWCAVEFCWSFISC